MSLASSRRAWQVYVIIHRDGGQRSDHFKMELQGLTAQPTMEAELVAAALTMEEEAVFCFISPHTLIHLAWCIGRWHAIDLSTL